MRATVGAGVAAEGEVAKSRRGPGSTLRWQTDSVTGYSQGVEES